jgi:hypothetical protein
MDRRFGDDKSEDSADAYSRFWTSPFSSDKGMPSPDNEVRAQLRSLATGPTWRPGAHPRVEDYLGSVKDYLELFKQEVQSASGYRYRPLFDPDAARHPLNMLLPRVGASRYAARCLLATAWRERPDVQARLLKAWGLSLRHAAHLQGSRQLMLSRIALEIRLTVYDSIRAAVGNGVLAREGLKQALGLLDTLDPVPFVLREAILIEWGGSLGVLQAMYPKGRLNRELAESIAYVGGKNGPRHVRSDEILRSGITPAQLAEAADEHYARLLSLAAEPASVELLRKLKQLDESNAKGKLGRHPHRASIQPTLRLVFRQQLWTLTASRGTRLLLATLIHLDGHSKLPATLQEICDQATIRTDPCSGREFVFRPLSAEGQTVTMAFMLYSVGEDGTDDGGSHGPWGDIYESAVPTGQDFVFWPFRGNR